MKENLASKQKRIFEKSKQKLLSIGKGIDNNYQYMTYDDNSDYSQIHSDEDLSSIITMSMINASTEENPYFKVCSSIMDKIDSKKMKAEDIGGIEVVDILEEVCFESGELRNFPNIIQLSEYLDKNNIISKNELVLSIMEFMYNHKVQQFLKVVKYDAGQKYDDSIFDTYDINERNEQTSKWNVEQWLTYEKRKEDYIETYFKEHFGENSPTPKKRKEFYQENWNNHNWSYLITESMFEEFGIKIDKKQVKNLYFEKINQKSEDYKRDIRTLMKEDRKLDNQIALEKDTQSKE